MNSEIISICGNSNYLPDFEAIGNDPNFVFVNDPTYLTVKLFDTEGNIINVNSWIECAHYVRGGWSNSINISSIDEERIFFIGTFIIFFKDLGLRKPDVKIFEYILKEQKLKAEEVFFIDDSPQHIASAKKIGIHCHHLLDDENIITLFPDIVL